MKGSVQNRKLKEVEVTTVTRSMSFVKEEEEGEETRERSSYIIIFSHQS